MTLRDRQILNIAMPSIVSNITVPLLGMVDVAITGHMANAACVGAIAVGGMLFNIIYWMFAFLRMGTSGQTAQARGARRFDIVRNELFRGIALALTASVVLIIAPPLIRYIAFLFMHPSWKVALLATVYFRICIWGAPASLGLFVFSGWYIGMQNSRIPMIIAIGQNVINICLSLFFVYWLHMGIPGVAWGTVIAQWAGFLIAITLYFVYYHRRILRMIMQNTECRMQNAKIQDRQPIPTGAKKFAFLFYNSSYSNIMLFLRTLCLIIVHFLFIAAGTNQGDNALAANTLIMEMFTLYSYFMDGFANAGEALAGKAIGARTWDIYHSVVHHLFIWGGVVALLFTMLYVFFGESFLGILTSNLAVIETINQYRYWMMLIPICGMAAFIWDGIYIGATRTDLMLLSMASSMCVFLLGYYTLIPLFGNHGLWISFLTYLFMRGVILTFTRHKISMIEASLHFEGDMPNSLQKNL